MIAPTMRMQSSADVPAHKRSSNMKRHHLDCLARTPAVALLAASAMLLSHTTLAQEHNADELAKKLANPVASLISVPFQFNTDFDIGPEEGTRTTLNFQPVIPMSISEDWNLIARIITPMITQEDVFGDSGTQSGLSDMTPTLFFSPKAPTKGGLVWGVGPVFLLPTATDDLLGGEKWGAGPSFVLLEQTESHLTLGILANHIWSVGGDNDRADISNTFFQPFITKGLGKGRTLTLQSETSYNWEAPDGHEWNIPINFVYGQVHKFGKQMMNFKYGVRYFADTPGEGPDWGLRLEISLLYPK
jgi:hypothetical protein